MAAERTFWHKGLRVDVWAKSFKWTGLPFTVFLGSPPDDDKIRKMIDTAQKAGNRFRPEPRGFIARLLGRWGYREGGVLANLADDAPPDPEAFVRFTGPPLTKEMQQLFGGYGASKIVGIIQLREGLRVDYASGATLLFAPIYEGPK